MPEILTGLIERVTYHNPENGFAVLKVQVKDRQDLVTVVGSTTSVSAGEHLEATGKWVVDREADPSVKIMLHLAWGGQNAQSRSFLDKALPQGVEFDILGQSYYPKWHGTLDDFRANLTDLAERYKQQIMIVEYSVPNVRQINDIVRGLPNRKGIGTVIWEPTKWEGPALFDAKGNTKPEIDVYPELAKEYGKP